VLQLVASVSDVLGSAPAVRLETRLFLRRIQMLAWVVAPLSVFGGAAMIVRRTVDRVPLWYAAADRVADRDEVRALFVGSSRTAAAIAASAFERAAGQRASRRVRSLNLGRGASTLVEHYFGIRRLFERHPDHLRGVQVFVESMAGAPDCVTWDDEWAHEDQPALLFEVMPVRELPRYWRTRTPVEEKVAVTLRSFTRPLRFIRRRERFRELLTVTAAQRVAAGQWRDAFATADVGVGDDLEGWDPEVTRTEQEWDALRRRQQEAANERRARQTFAPWEGSVEDDLVSLVRAHGGEVYFFELPLHSVLRWGLSSPARTEHARRFERWCASRGIADLTPEFRYTDADLPDWSHLDSARAPEFSRALARAWALHRTAHPSEAR
jgi:hypothetical protein